MDRPSPKSILITGGSSGIGAALARYYAAPGVTLFLSARSEQRLEDIRRICADKGAAVHPKTVDVTDRQGMADWIAACDAIAPLDLVIANAGIATAGDGALDRFHHTMDINVGGVANTIIPAGDLMAERGCGQVAIMASLAGFRGLPASPIYSATKAAVRVWGEALRPVLARRGVGLSVICPGFVRSNITDNREGLPFLMDADPAAAIIARGLARNRGRIAFPFPTAFFVWLMMALPDRLGGWMAKTFVGEYH